MRGLRSTEQDTDAVQVPFPGASYRHASQQGPAAAAAARRRAPRGWRAVFPRRDQPLVARICDWFARAGWLTLLFCGVAMIATPVQTGTGRQVAESVTLASVFALFAIFLGRLISATVAWPERRTASLVLIGSLSCWAFGSSVQNSVSEADLLRFPAPGEGFFIASYILMAVFLLLELLQRGGGKVSLSTAVEAVVTVGGAVCVAGAVLLSPISQQLHGHGVATLFALLYPVLDVLLAVVVLTDLVVQRHGRSSRSLALLAGFTLLAIADSTFVWNVSADVYDFGPLLSVCWGMAFALIVSGACGPREHFSAEGPRGSVIPPFVAALIAVLVLAFTNAGTASLYLVIPAVITLTAAGGRLLLALREANGAAEAFRLSLTDELTGLPNRRALLARLQETGDDAPLALLLLDLDGFKDVNDTLGHVAGDYVLRLIAKRLRGEVHSLAMVSRLGGDEFAIVVDTGEIAAATRAAEWIREVVAQPVVVHEHTFIMGASVGIAISDGAAGRGDLLRRSDIAMYQAKSTKVGSLLYDPDRDEFTTERLKTAEHLRLGIPDGQLRAWYQPQVDAETRHLTGVEALVRWEHPVLGVQSPAMFLPIARQSGLMPLLTETVVDLVLADVGRWVREGFGFQVSFNIAPPELLNPQLLERLLQRIDDAHLPPDTLVLEVTEDSLLADPERARRALQEIRRHRVQASIDDYGTGFSSLSYLRDLPVHELKLDRSFISKVISDPRSKIIIASTNQMAQGLGLRTVAEGVEDEPIADMIRELGIDILQGYFIARPMPAEELLPWVRRQQARLALEGREHEEGRHSVSGA